MRAARSVGAVVAVLALAGTACSSSVKPAASPPSTPHVKPIAWPAPPDPLARARAAGLNPETAESFAHHVHAHLDVFVNGKRVTVPAGLGINIHDPGVHLFNEGGAKAYGGINPPCKQVCISPLHTHDVSGVIHTESPTQVDNRLGQLFTEWGVKLTATCVDTYCKPKTKIAVYVNGTPFTGDPRTIDLSDRKEIAIVIGSPPASIPKVGDFSSV